MKSLRTPFANSILYDAIALQILQKFFKPDRLFLSPHFNIPQILKILKETRFECVIDQIRHGLSRLSRLQAQGFVDRFFNIQGGSAHKNKYDVKTLIRQDVFKPPGGFSHCALLATELAVKLIQYISFKGVLPHVDRRFKCRFD
ncbi:MAG: hypothetical protein PF795_01460 [Kiritimatiellae bacterium]|nr:hypothetical protein [Kiritimatiellia bacterium]